MPESGAAFAPLDLLRALRPRQWVKNGLVFLPLFFAVNLAWAPENLAPVPGLLLKLTAAALAFSALSGAVYLFNDLMDRQADAQHPTKQFRPIASGRIRPPVALATMLAMALAGVAGLGLISFILGGLGLLYLAINLTYSLGVKGLAVVDILLVASGYVIRTVAGALVIEVVPSPWLYATTAAAALFIVLGKRYSEVRLAGDNPPAQRPSLRQYAQPFTSQLLGIAAATALISYIFYTVEASNLPDNDTMLLTIPLVTFGLFRFLYLTHTSADAEHPELLIIRDWPMVLSIAAWIATSSLILLLNS